MKSRLSGLLVASAAVALFAAAPAQADSHEGGGEGTVKCSGINSCSGKGECAAADGSHECSGKNSCSGKGWVSVSAEECTEKGGTAAE